jgi:hypothetical protein
MYWLNVSDEYLVSIVRVTKFLQLDAEVVRRKYCVVRVRRFEVV